MALALDAIDYGGGAAGAVAVTLSNIAPISNALLVLDVAGQSTTVDWSIITAEGWTQAVANATGAMAAGQFYRISNGAETGINVDVGSGNMLATIRQYTGNTTSSVLDAANSDTTNANSAASTCYSGAASSTADGAAIAALCWRDYRFVDASGPHTLSNGFTLVEEVVPQDHGLSTNYPGIDLAFLSYTGSASRSTTSTQYDTGDENIGHIGLYKAATTEVTLQPGLYSNSQSFYAATITPGSVSLSAPLYTNTQSFYSPVVSHVILSITAVYADSVTMTSVTPRVTIDFP